MHGREARTLFTNLEGPTVGEPHADGTRTVFFELSWQPRSVKVADKSLELKVQRRPKTVAEVLVAPGTPVKAGKLIVRYEH